MIFFNRIRDTIIEDQISTIKRLQRELDERTDFEARLMNYILELLKNKEVKMTDKPIIINGVDVSGCKLFRNGICASPINSKCKLCVEISEKMCYYKQLKAKEKKLDKIKEILEIHKDNKCAICPKFDECFEHPSCDNIILQIIEDKVNG